jgi:lipoprotein-anchoring transpeptidase ErfK/SrfK
VPSAFADASVGEAAVEAAATAATGEGAADAAATADAGEGAADAAAADAAAAGDVAAAEDAAGEGEPSVAAADVAAADGAAADGAAKAEALSAATAAPYEAPLAQGTYLIRPELSVSRVLDIAGGSSDNGANVQIYDSNMTPAQSFTLSYDEKGLYTIRNVATGKVFDVPGAAAYAGANVSQYEANGSTAQKWVLVKSGAGYRVVSALSAGLVLDVQWASDANGANVQLWDANNSAAQTMIFMPLDPEVASDATVADGIYSIASCLVGNPVLDIPAATDTWGAQLQIWPGNGSQAQAFYIKLESDGFYSIRSLQSAASLDVRNANLVAGTPIVQWENNGSKAQRWAIESYPDGSVAFISKCSGMALDVAGGANSAGTKLQQWWPNGTWAQRFVLIGTQENALIDGIYSLVPAAHGDLRVDIQEGSYDAGANAWAHYGNDTAAQKFQAIRVAEGEYVFKALNSGHYLTAESDNVYQDAAAGGLVKDTQKWAVVRALGGITLINKSSGLAMSLGSGNNICATPLQGESPSFDASQVFRPIQVFAMRDGIYVINSIHGQVVDSASGLTNNGNNLQLMGANGTAAQIWRVSYVAGEYFTVSCVRSGRVMDIAGASTNDGANVWLYNSNKSDAQLWRAVPSGDGWFYLQSAMGGYLTGADGANFDGSNLITTQKASAALKFRFSEASYEGPKGTYVDVNITTQQLVFVKDGLIALECPVVTGAPWMPTPTGTFHILYKQSPSVLVGPGYASQVSYWMPFDARGDGLHDAWWQPTFGGDWYLSHGSHGCVNMPGWAAAEIYSLINPGDTVYVHY